MVLVNCKKKGIFRIGAVLSLKQVLVRDREPEAGLVIWDKPSAFWKRQSDLIIVV